MHNAYDYCIRYIFLLLNGQRTYAYQPNLKSIQYFVKYASKQFSFYLMNFSSQVWD